VTPSTPTPTAQKSGWIESLSGLIGGLSGGLRYFLHFLTYVYLLRFPLAAIAIVFALLIKAHDGAKMLAGAFDQSLFDQTLALGLTNILFVYTLSIIGHNVLGYSALRGTAHDLGSEKDDNKANAAQRQGKEEENKTDAEQPLLGMEVNEKPNPANPNKDHGNKTNLWHHVWNFICAATAFPVPLTAWYYSKGGIEPQRFWGAIIGGTVCGFGITTIVHVGRRIVSRGGHEKFDEKPPFMLFPKSWFSGLENSPRGLPGSRLVLTLFSKVKFNLTAGYLEKPPGNNEPRLLPGHGLALAMMAAFSVVYLFVGYKHCGTAIVYILLLLTWLCWFLSGLAFFLDKYSIPTVVTLLLYFAAFAWLPASDHYFQLSAVPAGTDPAFSSEYVLAERPHAAERPIILVAANGGGIQSAAWTAQVLTGLTESFATKDQQQRFLESIRLISGVSGGSVGTMFFVNEIRAPDSGQAMSFKNVVAEAEETGLEEVVWGLTYPDFWHAVAPWARSDELLDRGHALEEAWIKTADTHHSPPLNVSLLAWNRGVIEGWRPATIFNATLVESGERLQISTSPVRDTRQPVASNIQHIAGRQEFFDLFKGSIRIATAARLSASFPYVSPAARPTADAASALAPGTADKYAAMHVVDGGYFDNSGLCALTEWLQEGLTERENHWKETNQQPVNKKILVIQIRGFPNPETNLGQSAAKADSDPLSIVMRRGWFYQLYAPVSTMLGVMGSGQTATNDMEFYLLQKYWAEKHIDISTVIFQPDPSVCKLPDNPIPLSWHLRNQDKDLIDKAWKCELESKQNCKAVVKFAMEQE
jgi:hypothetical protein